MKTIRLDAARLRGRTEAMDLLERELDLPDWWGRNLDALHDCLTDLCQPLRLELENRDAATAAFFGRRLLRVLEDSARENPCLELADVNAEEE